MRTNVHIAVMLLMWNIFLLSVMDLSAQVLTAVHHKPQATDSLVAYKIPYINATDTGRHCVWDFSSIAIDTAETVEFDFFVPTSADTTGIGLHRERVNSYYSYAHDTLWLTEYEHFRTRVCYQPSVPLLRFPFAYGDSLKGMITGEGQYCHVVPLSIEGSYSIFATATGRLILPDVEIDSALQLYSRKIYHETNHDRNQVQEDRLLWFSPYCRYPLLESLRVRTIKDADTVLIASSYYIPQEQIEEPSQRTLKDPVNVVDSLITDVSYLPNPVYSDLQVKYTLIHAAYVYISVHYNGGVTTYQTPVHHEEEGAHTVSIHMSGMPVGTYVVYIHADDAVVSGNIIKL